tara:strand:+ start:666 stop:1142 length:477 start_codon:yes stop_codon:yes gene_type:complete
MDNFNKDLEFGNVGEDIVLKRIQDKHPRAYKITGKHKEYDIVIPKLFSKTTIEVKTDRTQHSNFFIETHHNNNLSGINATTADWWCYIIQDNFYLIETKQIKKCIKENNPVHMENLPKSTGTVNAYIIPKDTFIKYCFKKVRLSEYEKCLLNLKKVKR